MSEPLGMLPEIDRQVHEPARLAILTVLSACERADFLFLERATGLTRGNLSVQLSRLEEAGLIEIEKTIVAMVEARSSLTGSRWPSCEPARSLRKRQPQRGLAAWPADLPLPAARHDSLTCRRTYSEPCRARSACGRHWLRRNPWVGRPHLQCWCARLFQPCRGVHGRGA
jgi:hypothetical protein